MFQSYSNPKCLCHRQRFNVTTELLEPAPDTPQGQASAEPSEILHNIQLCMVLYNGLMCGGGGGVIRIYTLPL